MIKLKEYLLNNDNKQSTLSFFKGKTEYYLTLDDILFFETEEGTVYAHTKDDTYQVGERLYRLIDLLPSNFIRVSKSTILNINPILSINKNLASSSLVMFKNSHKQIFVSRHYFHSLQEKLKERKN